MHGFDPEFKDIIDYIIKITWRIWEGKQVDLCLDYYSDDCPVYTLAATSTGAEQVRQNTARTQAAFPDRVLTANNIIWGGNEIDGFHTSHLIDSQMTAQGDSEFAPANGRQARFQVIAHCLVKDNRIIREWLVRDNFSIAEQLGTNPYELAKHMAKQPAQAEFNHWRTGEIERLAKQPKSIQAQANTEQEKWLLKQLNSIWNQRDISKVSRLYHKHAKAQMSATGMLSGSQQIEQFYLDFMSTLPDLKVSLDYICSNSMRDDADYLAVRWTMCGTHGGDTLLGEASGETLLLIGESHYRLHEEQVIEEWTVFDRLAVLTQIQRALQLANN